MSATITSMGTMDPILGKNLGANLGKGQANHPSNYQGREAGTFASPAPATKPLWAAIGVLGVSVLAMGAGLVHISKRPAEPLPMASNASAQRAVQAAAPKATGADGGNSMLTEAADGTPLSPQAKSQDGAAKPAPKKVAKPVERQAAAPTAATRPAGTVVAVNAPRAAPTAASPATAPVVSSGLPSVAMGTPQPAVQTAPAPTAPVVQAAPAPVLAQAPARAVCANCGTIESVTPVTRAGKGASGVGTVAGGVVGGVLGRQVGDGRGKDIATVLGAVGGAVAGNAIEKNIKKETVYAVRVSMEDGSTRSIEQASAPAVGAKVRVDGNTLRVE